MGKYKLGQDIQKILNNQGEIMATLKQISDQVAALKTAVDTEQQEIKDAMDELSNKITDLTNLVADGGTVEERQAILSGLQEIHDDVVSTVTRPLPPVEIPPVVEPPTEPTEPVVEG